MRPAKTQERREHPRKPCRIAVKGHAWDSAFEALARNASLGGVFIETPCVFAVDEEIVLSFTLPGQDESVKIIGKIVWNVPGGLGIQFIDTPERLVKGIKSLG